LLTKFQEELQPCESFAEFFDVLGKSYNINFTAIILCVCFRIAGCYWQSWYLPGWTPVIYHGYWLVIKLLY